MKLLNRLLDHVKSKNTEWEVILEWFKNYKPKDKGVQFIWDSLYDEDKYLQSYHMYAGMLKFVLYLYRSEVKKDFPFEYSSDRVNFIDNFFATEFYLTEGSFSGKKFILEPNQVYKLSMLFGFSKIEQYKSKEEKDKGIIFMVHKFYDVETRKNGKSMFFAGLANILVHNPFGNDFKSEIYATGPLQEASKIIYDKAQDIAKANAKLRNEFVAVNLRRFETHSGAKIKDLPFEKASLEGKNPTLSIATEYHLHDNDTMVDSIESAQNVSRINSLLVFDTTKGEGIFGVAYTREHDYKELTLEQLENPFENIGYTIATFMAEVDEEDLEDSISNPWETNPLRKSTPMLGVTVSLESLQAQWEVAKRNPTQKREFLIKKFGKWIGNLQSLITLDDLKKCNDKWKDKFKIEDFDGANAIISVDLANTGDTNAVTLIFKTIEDGQEIPLIYSKIFIPDKTLKQRIDKERKPYWQWIQDGWVITSGEASVNHGDIAKYINECIEKYNVTQILFDPYQKHIIDTYLIHTHGISSSFLDENSEVKQNAATLSSTMEDYVKRVVDGNVYFFNNPVFIDHNINMKPQFNSQGQIYWTKQKQEQRVDIFATCVTGMYKFKELLPWNTKSTTKVEAWVF